MLLTVWNPLCGHTATYCVFWNSSQSTKYAQKPMRKARLVNGTMTVRIRIKNRLYSIDFEGSGTHGSRVRRWKHNFFKLKSLSTVFSANGKWTLSVYHKAVHSVLFSTFSTRMAYLSLTKFVTLSLACSPTTSASRLDFLAVFGFSIWPFVERHL